MLKLIPQLLGMVWSRRKWWLIPVILALLLVGGLIVAGELMPLSPFIYPL